MYLVFAVICSAQSAQEFEATHSGELAGVTRGPALGEDLQGSLTGDDELELDDQLSGGDNGNTILPGN